MSARVLVIFGFVASLITIFTFVTGIPNIWPLMHKLGKFVSLERVLPPPTLSPGTGTPAGTGTSPTGLEGPLSGVEETLPGAGAPSGGTPASGGPASGTVQEGGSVPEGGEIPEGGTQSGDIPSGGGLPGGNAVELPQEQEAQREARVELPGQRVEFIRWYHRRPTVAVERKERHVGVAAGPTRKYTLRHGATI